MTRFYLSWHPSINCVCTRCFDSADEREQFRRRVDCRNAQIKTWEYTIEEE